jgi:hypothetical protein
MVSNGQAMSIAKSVCENYLFEDYVLKVGMAM